MTREETLDTAKQMVCGHREQEYGSPEDNFKRIAAFWSSYKGIEFSAEDIAMMMALLKIARIQSGNATKDSFIDLAGYAACGAEITFPEEKKKTITFPTPLEVDKQPSLYANNKVISCDTCLYIAVHGNQEPCFSCNSCAGNDGEATNHYKPKLSCKTCYWDDGTQCNCPVPCDKYFQFKSKTTHEGENK